MEGKGFTATVITCQAGRQACISGKLDSTSTQHRSVWKHYKSLGESGDKALECILHRLCSFGWCGVSTGRKKVSFCHYTRILLSITVCQTATNELISIFLTDISIHSMCLVYVIDFSVSGEITPDGSLRKRSPERTFNLSAPKNKGGIITLFPSPDLCLLFKE